jgi:hypothetical protein
MLHNYEIEPKLQCRRAAATSSTGENAEVRDSNFRGVNDAKSMPASAVLERHAS